MKGENTPPSTSPSNLTKAKLVLAAAFSPRGEISRARKCMDFISILLFTIGSMFYMHLSCLDFKYGVIELRSLPVSVYTAEDKTVLYTYIEEHDDHNYADDYIPNLQLNGYGVSYYQISYICAGLCFVIAGLVDMINEKSCWPIFRLVAGSTTLAAAICISGDSYTLTNTLNLTSTHFYLLDSLTLFRKEMCCAVYPTESGKWMKKYLLFGDFTYFAGSAIDVPVRQMMNEQSILF